MATEVFAERYMRYLRVWIGFVAIMALGNTVQCFVDPQLLKSKLYTVTPSNVNGLVARLFGVWTLLSGVLRFYCAVDIYNKACQNKNVSDKLVLAEIKDGGRLREVAIKKEDETILRHIRDKDCVAVEVRYHLRCYKNYVRFLTRKPTVQSSGLYNLTYLSFYLALGHFVSEVLLFKSAGFTVGVMAPLLVSSLSILTMSIGYLYLDRRSSMDTSDENKSLAAKLRSGKYKRKD